MQTTPIDVVASGHICLDIIPRLSNAQRCAKDLFVPGGLVQVGPATLALGGSVANTGLALHRLGARTRFVGKIGDDLLGKAILESLRHYDSAFSENMVVAAGEATSYTIVISPPHVDRSFLHCPGANDSFVAADLDSSSWMDSRILHFGYPPLMRGIAANEGSGLAEKFAEVQATGLLVSLDMAMCTESTPERTTNWKQWLRRVLPHVDLFLPSVDEITPMLVDEPELDRQDIGRRKEATAVADVSHLTKLANQLLEFGVPIVLIKLGDQGLYLRTSENVSVLSSRAAWRDFDWRAWRDRELLAPCFDVEVVGTTGAGDCTIAGFLMAMLRGYSPEAAIIYAASVGAHCVQSADATSNIPTWSEIETADPKTWPKRESTICTPDWRFCPSLGLHAGPADAILPHGPSSSC